MNKASTIFAILFLSFCQLKAQTFQLDTIGALSSELTEISGLVKGKSGVTWAINDSGNEPVVFQLNASGKIVKKVFVTNASNVDWEDLTIDDDGFVYIGDFGNNRNQRKDLKIYKVKEDLLLKKDSIQAEVINFIYQDQQAFPPSVSKRNFDMEAMVWNANRLLLFSKNRTEPFTGYSNVYMLPSNPGSYVAEKIDSLYLGKGPKEFYQVTAADISPKGDDLVLLSYDKLFLIHDFPFNDLIGGRVVEIYLEELSQKESIAWNGDSAVIISDEKSVLGGGYLYGLNLAAAIKENSEVRKKEVRIPIKEFRDSLSVEFTTEVRGKVYYEFFNGEGGRVEYGVVGYFDRGTHTFELTPTEFPNGTYMLNIQIGKRPHAFFVYRFNEVDWQKVKADFEKREIELQNRQTSEPEK